VIHPNASVRFIYFHVFFGPSPSVGERPDGGGRAGRGGSKSTSCAGVYHPLLCGPAQGAGLVLERLCGSHLSIHEDDDRDVLRVRSTAPP
jgi:hypothetical protein